MSSRRFVPVPHKTIWFWLIMFTCFGLAASFMCYECDKDECKKPNQKKVKCEAGRDEDPACATRTHKNGKLERQTCNPVPKGEKPKCKDGFCVCFEELCNKSGGASGLMPWKNLLWIGLVSCFYIRFR